MFIVVSSYFALILILFWSYCGYTLTLYLFTLFNGSKPGSRVVVSDEALEHILVVVPCYNEADHLAAKIENLQALNYPKERLRVLFVDGGSSDGSIAMIRAAVDHHPGWQLEQSPIAAKIDQMNLALTHRHDEPFVLSTDVDAILDSDSLRQMAQLLQQRPDVGVVGANITPGESALDIERQYWSDQNCIRYLESNAHSSSIVVAPAYLFRAEIFSSFPEDCIADDIYAAFVANARGYRVEYLRTARGRETRVPTNIRDYVTHKFRKGNAYITELLRFSYQFPRFEPLWKVIFFTKFLQVVVCPWVIPYWLLATLSLLLGDETRQEIAIVGLVFLMAGLVITSLLIQRIQGKSSGLDGAGQRKRHMFAAFFLNNMVMLLVGLTFPFYSQSSSYRKIGPVRVEQP
ncbi:MAG: glycosyltransferase [Gammaproteobacteria bacterium]|nr:glycosyltransferase [Gammaproteobacteria bacterium]